MLKEKLDQCSKQKDSLFGVKANKMREVSHSIHELDNKISEKRNLIENEIDARLREAQTTLAFTKQKISDVETAHLILVQKVDITEKSIDELRVQENSMQREKDRVN